MNLASKANSMVELAEKFDKEFSAGLPELYELYPELRPDNNEETKSERLADVPARIEDDE